MKAERLPADAANVPQTNPRRLLVRSQARGRDEGVRGDAEMETCSAEMVEVEKRKFSP